jgi:hypothetical protein
LEQLLDENLKSTNMKITIRHNDDYDSELTDFDEEAAAGGGKSSAKSSAKSPSNVSKQPSYIPGGGDSDCGNDEEDDDSDEKRPESCSMIKQLVKDRREQHKAAQVTHRSIRLGQLDLTIKESPGVLTRNFYEVVKNMKTSNSVINPTALFSSVCKK